MVESFLKLILHQKRCIVCLLYPARKGTDQSIGSGVSNAATNEPVSSTITIPPLFGAAVRETFGLHAGVVRSKSPQPVLQGTSPHMQLGSIVSRRILHACVATYAVNTVQERNRVKSCYLGCYVLLHKNIFATNKRIPSINGTLSGRQMRCRPLWNTERFPTGDVLP